LKVLPEDTTVDLDALARSVSSSLPTGAHVRNQRVEPIAFGLSAVMLDVIAPEEEGAIESVEKSVSATKLVGQCEVVGVSRMSSRLPPQ